MFTGPTKKTKKQEEREEKFGPPTILVVSEIVALPGEKKKPTGAPKKATGKGKAAAGKKTAAKKAPAGDDDLNDKAIAAVMETALLSP